MTFWNLSKEYDPRTGDYHVSVHKRTFSDIRLLDTGFSSEHDADLAFDIFRKLLNHKLIYPKLEEIELELDDGSTQTVKQEED